MQSILSIIFQMSCNECTSLLKKYERYELEYAAAICRLHMKPSIGPPYVELRSAADGRRLDSELVRRQLNLHILEHLQISDR
jgi:hypothetical protein